MARGCASYDSARFASTGARTGSGKGIVEVDHQRGCWEPETTYVGKLDAHGPRVIPLVPRDVSLPQSHGGARRTRRRRSRQKAVPQRGIEPCPCLNRDRRTSHPGAQSFSARNMARPRRTCVPAYGKPSATPDAVESSSGTTQPRVSRPCCSSQMRFSRSRRRWRKRSNASIWRILSIDGCSYRPEFVFDRAARRRPRGRPRRGRRDRERCAARAARGRGDLSPRRSPRHRRLPQPAPTTWSPSSSVVRSTGLRLWRMERGRRSRVIWPPCMEGCRST